jgi:O-antigen ligase
MDWARTNQRAAYTVIWEFAASIVLGGALVGAIGGARIWSIFNRGQSAEGIESASGRTEIWKYVVQYSLAHPQGMGYVAGFRILFRSYFTLGLDLAVNQIGNAHNTFLQFLADAGWVALAIYLLILAKVLALGFRYARKRTSAIFMPDKASCHALRCALVLLIYFLVEGLDAADFAIPLRVPFYFQYITTALILASSARMIAATRRGYICQL